MLIKVKFKVGQKARSDYVGQFCKSPIVKRKLSCLEGKVTRKMFKNIFYLNCSTDCSAEVSRVLPGVRSCSDSPREADGQWLVTKLSSDTEEHSHHLITINRNNTTRFQLGFPLLSDLARNVIKQLEWGSRKHLICISWLKWQIKSQHYIASSKWYCVNFGTVVLTDIEMNLRLKRLSLDCNKFSMITLQSRPGLVSSKCCPLCSWCKHSWFKFMGKLASKNIQ